MTTTPENCTDQPASGATDVGTLLGIWAHPDDEAYLSADLMATARAAGHHVVVATATKGELGIEEPELVRPERLALIRERETLASLAALNVREHRWLGHRDGCLDRVPAACGIGQVRDLIDEIRPDTIVTFGPDGMTGHADHRAVCRWVMAAWHRSGRPCRLWYATVTPGFHRDWTDVNSAVGFWFGGTTPPCDRAAELAFTVTCDEAILDRKSVALRAHASQTTLLIERIGQPRYRRWWSTESFVDASTHERRTAA